MQAETKQLITKDMTIGEVIQKYPSVIEPLLETGVHCVGCGASYWETLEQGLKGHGMPDEMVDEVVAKLNGYVKDEAPAAKEEKVLSITKKAAEKITELQVKQKKEGQGLRVMVVPGGCSGFSYGFDWETKAQAEDVVVEEQGVKLFVDKNSMEQLKGSKLDYVDAFTGAGFRISNPNASSSCGCGQSFR